MKGAKIKNNRKTKEQHNEKSLKRTEEDEYQSEDQGSSHYRSKSKSGKGKSLSSSSNKSPYFSDGEFANRHAPDDFSGFLKQNKLQEKLQERRWTMSGAENDKVSNPTGRLKSNSQTNSPSYRNTKTGLRARSHEKVVLADKMMKVKAGIVQWSKEVLKDSSDIKIENISDFYDGTVLLAILNTFDPTIISCDISDKSDALKNLETAFFKMEEVLNVPCLLDSSSVYKGDDNMGLLMYISMIKIKYDELTKASNPIEPTRTLIRDLKLFINKNLDQISSITREFEKKTDTFETLCTQDEFAKEKEFYEEKSNAMEDMLQQVLQLNSQIDNQNKALRDQNKLLTEKLTVLEEIVKQESSLKEKFEQELNTFTQLKTLSELIKEPDIVQYLIDNKGKIEEVNLELATVKDCS